MDTKERSNVPSLVCAFMASLTTGGTTYAFGLYGQAMKKTLGLSQSELDTISTAFFVAGLFSWIPGLCADRYGTRVSLPLGGFLGAASLLSYWTVSRQFVIVRHDWLVPILSILGVAIFLSNALTTGSVFKIIVGNCGPGTKGAAVGVAKGFVGLGAGAYACLFEAIRRPMESDLDFLPMAAFFAIACASIPGLMILPTKQQVEAEPFVENCTSAHFRTLYFALLGMALLIIGNSINELLQGNTSPKGDEEDEEENHSGPHYGIAFLLVSIWLGPITALLYLPRREYSEVELTEVVHAKEPDGDEVLADESEKLTSSSSSPNTRQRSMSPNRTDRQKSSRSLQDNNNSSSDEEVADNDATVSTPQRTAEDEEDAIMLLHDDEEENDAILREPLATEDANLVEMLMTPTALLMLWTTTILVGAGTVETNNMGQMVEALGFHEAVTPASLALFSVAQAGSRVATGAISESALTWNVRGFGIDKGVPRPFFLVMASIVALVAHLILGFATNEALFVIGATLAGAAFGMVWPLMVLIVGEVFGTENVGANYMFFDGFTSAIGTLLLSKFVAQTVYEDHIPEDAQDKLTCLGMGCFRQTHLLIAFLTLTCIATSFGTLHCSRHVYNRGREHRT